MIVKLKKLDNRVKAFPKWFAFRHYQEIFSKNPDELRAWYPKFQREIIAHFNKPQNSS